MQCQICSKNEATIHLTEINDGVRTEMHVCENCAAEEGIAVKSQMPIKELLSSLLASQPPDDESFESLDTELSCPHCGFTLEQFHKNAVLGCPHDYDVFEKSLSPLIEKAHDGQTTHHGKVPSNAPKDAKQQVELLSLRQRLDLAIKAEDYERAAKLRDKITQCEKPKT